MCLICYEDNDSDSMLITICNHTFCFWCALKMRKIRRPLPAIIICPFCRRLLNVTPTIAIYDIVFYRKRNLWELQQS